MKKTAWWEYLVRFGFGGVITVITGLIASKWGPVVGGLFLAFPAILPASLTLIKRHAGSEPAGVSSLGAVLGSLGMAAFGAIVWLWGASGSPWVVLAAAAVIWFAVAAGAWRVGSKVTGPS